MNNSLIKLAAILDLFRKGRSVMDKEAWKNRQITATVLGTVIMAGVQVAKVFGVELPPQLDEDTITLLSGGLIGLVNIVLTYTTSDKAGILPEKNSQE